jgi:hypothetical protein
MLREYEKYNVKLLLLILIIGYIFFFSTHSMAQSSLKSDSTILSSIKVDSNSLSQKSFKANPKRAAIYSAICPGLGQIYNRRYWKLPLVYAGVGATIYFIDINYSGYANTRKGIARLQDNDITNDELPILVKDYTFKKYDLKANGATEEDLLRIKKYFRQNLDYSILALTAIYLLNIVDANVDAHLSGFNMSDNLTLAPIVNQQGIGIALQLK